MITEETAQKVYRRASNKCEECRCYGKLELHHALYGRNRNNPELDAEENLLLLCRRHHSKANGYKYRVKAWKQLCAYYGRNHMIQWRESLNLKVKEQFD